MKIQKTFVSTITVLVFALALCSGAHAQEGFFVGGSFGKGYLDENINGISIDSDSSIYRIFGGYGFTPYLGMEVAYLDLGTFRDDVDLGGVLVPVAVSADGFQLGGVATIPLSERFSIKGRLGFFFFDGESEADGIIEQNPSESRPYVGLGLAYGLNEAIDLNLGVDYLDTADADPVLAMLGLTVRF
jgi:OOP family OmpA-OmpF porin